MRLALVSILALAAVFMAGRAPGGAQTIPADVSIGSALLEPNQSSILTLDAAGVSDALGAVTVDIHYNPALLTATACVADPGQVFDLGVCNKSYAPDTVRFVGISATGVSGDIVLASPTFRAIGAAGTSSALDVDIVTFADTLGADIPAADHDGAITIDFDGDSDGVGDSIDNCLALANSGQQDTDGEGLGDDCDPCPADADCDSDSAGMLTSQGTGHCRFTSRPVLNDCIEAFAGTDPLLACPITATPGDEEPDARPTDFNDDRVVNVLDIVQVVYAPYFGATPPSPNYSPRRDLVPDDVINIFDVFKLLPPSFGSSCTP